MKNLSVFMFVLAFSIFVGGCSKEGAQGPQGIQGIPGEDGNANVHSYIYNVTSWSLESPDYYNYLLANYITSDIINNGAVLVYMENSSGTAWLPLPYTEWRSTYAHLINAVIAVGGVTIWVSDSDLTEPGYPGDITFKVVAIAGTTKSAIAEEVDLNNYDAVVNYLKLKK